MKRTLSLWAALAALLLPALVHAAPAPPFPFEVEQPDGTSLTVVAEGDEFGMVVETADGYALARGPGGWWSYARAGADGRLEPTGRVPGKADPSAAGLARHLRPSRAVQELAALRRAEANRSRGVHPVVGARKREVVQASGAGAVAFAYPGAEGALQAVSAGMAPATFRLAVLLIEFPFEQSPWSVAVPHTYEPAQIHEMMFSVGTYHTSPLGAPVAGSTRDYYREVSFGQFDLTGQVFPWVVADHGMEWYHAYSGGDQPLRDEAVAKSGVDLSQFDGYAVVFAGRSHLGGNLWPHATLGGPYYMTSEKFAMGDDLSAIGPHCHEFGHVLGLLDLYNGPTNVGAWSLMGTGDYGGSNTTATTFRPVQLLAFEKELLGWVFPRVLGEGSFPGLTLRAWNDYPDAVKIISQAGVYFAENRQRAGWDQDLLGTGVIVTDVRRGDWNAPADVEEADGGPAYDAGDPFPGTTGNTAFGCATVPSSRDADGTCSVALSSIGVSGSVASFDAAVDWPAPGAGIRVSGAGDFPNTHTAVETAAPGQTVELPAGTFAGGIILKPGVSLRGAGAGKTFLTPPPAGAVTPFMVEGADDTTVSGFTFQGAGKTGDAYRLRTGGSGTIRIANNAFVALAGAVDVDAWNFDLKPSTGVLEIVNNVFDGNYFGITGEIGDDPIIMNDVFVGNDYGVYFYNEGTSTATIDYNDFFGNVTAYLGPTRQTVGRNNLAVDPRFRNAAAGDYGLAAGSPLVNAGSPAVQYVDLDGTRNDMGVGGGPLAVVPPAVPVGASVTDLGKYQTTTVGKTRTTVWVATAVFKRGEAVVLRLLVTDGAGAPVSGATVKVAIAGPASAQLVSAATGTNGVAEAKWATTAPSGKNAGTPLGAYTATITGVTGAGVAWNGQGGSVGFTVQ